MELFNKNSVYEDGKYNFYYSGFGSVGMHRIATKHGHDWTFKDGKRVHDKEFPDFISKIEVVECP